MTMRKAILFGCVAAGTAALGATALAQHQGHGDHQLQNAQKAGQSPINSTCPIGKDMPIDPSVTTEYKGNTIALGCDGCRSKFLMWDEGRKDAYVSVALASYGAQDHAGHGHGAGGEGEPWTEPYTLGTCPVSGEEFGSMGDSISKTYDGREVRFCCKGCVGKFEADQAGFFKKIDEQIVKDQLPFYPVQTCIVSGEPLTEGGEDISVNYVYGNRLVRLCCKMCKGEFKADPEAFIAKLNKAAVDAQRPDYPLMTCPVSGGELGSMGEPTEHVFAGRLFRFCCDGCLPKVEADPHKYLATLDAAWRVEGKFKPAAHDDGDDHEKRERDHDGHAGHDHGDHDDG